MLLRQSIDIIEGVLNYSNLAELRWLFTQLGNQHMSVTSYLNFDLLIQRLGDAYHVEVIDSPVGQAAANFKLPFTQVEINYFALSKRTPTRNFILQPPSTIAGSISDAQKFGTQLFEAVFTGDLDTCLMRSLDAAERQEAGLRIRFRLDDSVAELAELPWEYLYIPQLARFAALSNQTSIVRYVKLGRPEKLLKVPPPLSILAIVASPQDVAPLNVEQEWRHLQQAVAPLQARNLVQIEQLEKPTLAILRQRLRQKEFHILHFIGHGMFDPTHEVGGLIFEDEKGQAQIVTAPVLATRLHDHPSLRLIFLNACEGAQTDQDNFFAGTAQMLVQQGIPAVIAMQSPISDQAALALSQEFYQALVDGYPVDAALGEARKVINEQEGTRDEWGTPVLYTHAPDGVLWQQLPVTTASTPDLISPTIRRVRPYLAWGALGLLLFCLGWLWLSLGQSQPVPAGSEAESPTVPAIDEPPIQTNTTVQPLLTASPLEPLELPTSAPVLTTTISLVGMQACPELQQRLQLELHNLLIDAIPPVYLIEMASARQNQPESIDLAIACVQQPNSTLVQFNLLTMRSTPEIFEPHTLLLEGTAASGELQLQVLRAGTAFAQYARRNYPEAAQRFQSAASAEPISGTAVLLELMAGNSLLLARDYVEASELFSSTLQLHPTVAAAHYSWAVAQVNQNWLKPYLFEPALNAITQTLTLSPTFMLAHILYGQILEQQGRAASASIYYKQASQIYQQALEAAPTMIQAQARIGLLNAQTQLQFYLPEPILTTPDRELSNLSTPYWALPLLVTAHTYYVLWQFNPSDQTLASLAAAELRQALQASHNTVQLEYARSLFEKDRAALTEIQP